jgi:hypothetical protein
MRRPVATRDARVNEQRCLPLLIPEIGSAYRAHFALWLPTEAPIFEFERDSL